MEGTSRETITLTIEEEATSTGVFTASSDVKGLVAHAPTRNELIAKMPQVIRLTFRALGRDVDVKAVRVVFEITSNQPMTGQLAGA